MVAEKELRDKVATCSRIFAMQGLLCFFGHVSAYDAEHRRVFLSPGMGSDRSKTKDEDIFILDQNGRVLQNGDGVVPVEWPIHTALHAARSDALAVAHLHSPYATLYSIAKRTFRPVTLQGALFAEGVPLYSEANLITTPAQGQSLVEVITDKRAVLLRGHGIVVVGKSIEEVLYSALVLEDEACKAVQASMLGEVGVISFEECRAFDAESGLQRRSRRAWDHLVKLEARWDRQPGTGRVSLLA